MVAVAGREAVDVGQERVVVDLADKVDAVEPCTGSSGMGLELVDIRDTLMEREASGNSAEDQPVFVSMAGIRAVGLAVEPLGPYSIPDGLHQVAAGQAGRSCPANWNAAELVVSNWALPQWYC